MPQPLIEKPFIDFYNLHKISPVSQDITDIKRHWERRYALYRHCGIPPGLVRGIDVLEIGPGTGHNALYTNSLQPKRYVMVDGADQSIKSLKKNLAAHFSDISNIEIIENDIHNFNINERFDLVLCEGTIPFQKKPQDFLKHISKFVTPSGLMVITCIDSVSDLSETLRRIIAFIIFHEYHCNKIRERFELIRPVFAPHLKTLQGMSRSIDDWIFDNILQPLIGDYLSIKDAIKAIEDKFDVYGSSPHFFTDWRWYKDIYGKSISYNEIAVDLYLKNVNNLLDYRCLFDQVDIGTGNRLINLCNEIFNISILLQNKGPLKKDLKKIVEVLEELCTITNKCANSATDSIAEVISGISDYLKGNSFPIKKLDKFCSWFGRGQQYLSFIKKSNETV